MKAEKIKTHQRILIDVDLKIIDKLKKKAFNANKKGLKPYIEQLIMDSLSKVTKD